MESIQREEQKDYFAGMMQKIVSEWDPYVNNLKKSSLPLQPTKLSEVQSKKEDLSCDLDWIYSLDKQSPIAALILKLSRKLRYDCYFFLNYDEALGKTSAIRAERHAQCQAHVILAELEAIKQDNDDDDEDDVNAENEAIEAKHQEEDDEDSKDIDEADVLNACSQVTVKAANKRTKKRKCKAKKSPPSPRPMKLRKAMTMKILMRRKRIQDRVRILLDPARRPQCHLFPPGKQVNRVKLSLYRRTQSQLVSDQNRRLQKRRHLGTHGNNLQSRARRSRLSNTKADEASLGNNSALPSEGHCYDSFPSVEDTYYADIPQGDAVKVRWWLFHHHFI